MLAYDIYGRGLYRKINTANQVVMNQHFPHKGVLERGGLSGKI